MRIIKLILSIYLVAIFIECDAQSYSRLYDHTNSPIDENNLHSLAIDSSQVVWLGSYPYVYRFRNGIWQNIEPNYFADTISSRYFIPDIKVSQSGEVWLSKAHYAPHENKSLFQFTGENCKSYIASDLTLEPSNIFLDGNNIPWFVMKNWWPHQAGFDQIGTIQNNALKIVSLPWRAASFTDLVIKLDTIYVSVYADPSGILRIIKNDWSIIETINWRANHIWNDGNSIMAGGDRLCKYNGGNFYFYDSVDTFLTYKNANVSSFIRESESTFWVGTDKGHLLKVINGKVQLVQEYSNSEIYDLVIDKRNNKWMILKNKGVSVYNENGIVNVDIDNAPPLTHKLYQNYPNPFNPSTMISYSIPKSQNVQIIVYDLLGREIQTLLNKYQTAGTYEILFDGTLLPSGIYFYKITSGNFSETKKMILIK